MLEVVEQMEAAVRDNIATLVPTKSDKELADEIRANLMKVYQPVLDILTTAKRDGFEVAVHTGADGFGIVRLLDIKVMKNY